MSRDRTRMLVSRFEEDRGAIAAQLTKAVAAIKKYAVKKEEEAQKASGTVELISSPVSFTVTFALDKIPKAKDYRFHEVPVPHRLVDAAEASMCLLARDPKERAVEAVKSEELPFEKIITVKSLKKKYASHEARKELCSRFDLFFCEDAIYEMMGSLLGRNFFELRKAKIPTPLKKLTKACFEESLKTAKFRLRGGPTFGVRIGTMAMESDQLVENAMAVIAFMATKFCISKKTLNDVFQVGVSATNVIELPVWSVPVVAADAAIETPVTTPKKQVEVADEKSEPKSSPDTTPVVAAALPDIASVPVKQLKQLQKARAEAAKQQVTSEPIKRRKTTANRNQ